MPEGRRIVVVGGVAGGASAAARARRLSESSTIVVFERGPYVSFANCGLPYHIAGVIPDRKRLLVQTPESLRARFGLDVRVNSEVLRIDRDAKEIVVREAASRREYREAYDALVLSPGAEPIRPPVPGVNDPRILTLRNMEDMDRILEIVSGGHPVAALVVGAGYIGLEMAEALRHRGASVVLVERLPQVMGVADPEMVAPLHDELRRQGVDLRLGVSVEAFESQGHSLEARLSDGSCVSCGLAIISVGVRPDTRLARDAGLEIGASGGIRVDAHMCTSDSAIWAVGDAVEVKDLVKDGPALIPLAGPANRQGRIAADNILGRESAYAGTQGTAICKVFDLAFAMTGASEAALERAGRSYRRIYVHPADHATYYPGAQPISLKLLFDPVDGRILGAQAVGKTGVDKRIDVLATALRAGMSVFDLEDAELCYAPPFGSAKDPINMAGFVASNVLRGDVALWEPEELSQLSPEQVLLDVRTPAEFEAGTIPGAVCVPVDDLRTRISELPKGKELLVFCRVGLRAYVAARLLSQRGFRVRNLSGGYIRYLMWKGTSAGAGTDAMTAALAAERRPAMFPSRSGSGRSTSRALAPGTSLVLAATGVMVAAGLLGVQTHEGALTGLSQNVTARSGGDEHGNAAACEGGIRAPADAAAHDDRVDLLGAQESNPPAVFACGVTCGEGRHLAAVTVHQGEVWRAAEVIGQLGREATPVQRRNAQSHRCSFVFAGGVASGCVTAVRTNARRL